MDGGKEPRSAVPRQMPKKQEQRSSWNPTIYGRDKEMIEMFDLLLSDGASGSVGNMSVIAIVGVEGIGKTTFADLVYSDDRVKSRFELRCWVKFREDLDAESLTKMILDTFDEGFHEDDSITELMGRLRKCLHGKKFLLVLDGCQKLAGWETLLKCFADAADRGSAVILTAQKVVDALQMLSEYIFHLGLLSPEDSYSLFSEHAFGNRDPDSLPELVSVAIQIVRKLEGLPLAVKNLGSLLHHHQDIHTWKKLLKMERSKLLDLKLLLVHCPELQHQLSLQKLEMSECDRIVDSPPNMPAKHELMIQEHDCTHILATSVAEVTSESFVCQATIEKEGTIIMPPITSSGDGGGGGEAMYVSYLESSEVLKVTHALQLRNLPSGLKSVTIEGCQYLEFLPDKFLSDCSGVVELSFIDCPSLKHFADVLHPNSLKTLYIHKCSSLEFFIPLGTHEKFAFLKYLSIVSSCESLTSISMNLFPRLEVLYIKDCSNLETISLVEGLNDQNMNLVSLQIRDCPRLKSFSRSGWPTPSLKSILISNCRSLKSLPNCLATLTSLQSLVINKCPDLESFPDTGLPSSLISLSITLCDKLAPQKEWKLHMLHSLAYFEIEGGCIGMKSFPSMGLLPRNLKSLRISKLSSLRVLDGMGLQHLTALEKLEINCCHGLYSLPEEGGLPSSLTSLSIKESSILTLNVMDKAGVEWNKIAHIPNLQITDRTIHGVEKEWETPIPKQRSWTRISATKPTELEVNMEGDTDDSDGKGHASQHFDPVLAEMEKHVLTEREKNVLTQREKQGWEDASSQIKVLEAQTRIAKEFQRRFESYYKTEIWN